MTTTKELWNIDPDLPEIAQACSLALGVLSECSVTSWKELCDGLSKLSGPVYKKFTGLSFEGWQEEILDEYQPEFQYLKTSPLQTLAVCPKCEQWIVLNSDVPKRCLITLGCTGLPIKVTAANKVSKKVADKFELGATQK